MRSRHQIFLLLPLMMTMLICGTNIPSYGEAATPVNTEQIGTVSANFSVDKSHVILGEPIWLNFTVVNHSSFPILFDETYSHGAGLNFGYDFKVYDTEGRLITSSFQHGGAGGYAVRINTVQPGETYVEHLILQNWLDIESTGSYMIACRRDFSFIRLHSASAGVAMDQHVLASNRVFLDVLPANEQNAGQEIQELSKHALDETSGTQSESTLTLAHIHDTRIIPIMAQILRQDYKYGNLDYENAKFQAIAGLSQFASDEAADALLPALTRPDSNLYRSAGNALKAMHRTDYVLPTLMGNFMSSSSIPKRVLALQALGATQSPNAFGTLIDALRDPEPEVRYEAAKSLGTLGDVRGIALLESKLQDSDMDLRLASITGLAELKVPFQTEWLLPMLRRSDVNGRPLEPLSEAITLLQTECRDQAVRILVESIQLDDPSPANDRNCQFISQLMSCENRPKYDGQWRCSTINPPSPEDLENNQKILNSIKAWLQTQPQEKKTKRGKKA